MVAHVKKIIPSSTRLLEEMATRNPIFYKMLSIYYKELIKNEAELAKITPDDKVLFIGGGVCPMSGILIHEYTGAKVTVIDNDSSCIGLAQNMIRELGYQDDIQIIHHDGKDILTEDYTVIHMAVQITPVEKVFKHIRKKSRMGTRILVRLPKKSLTGFYFFKDKSIFKNRIGSVLHRWRNIASTELFVKS